MSGDFDIRYEKHLFWLEGKEGGERFVTRNEEILPKDLSGYNLSHADLFGARLNKVNLSGANLSGANLSHANLFDADLSAARLIEANLLDANLIGADLTRAILIGASIDLSTIQRDVEKLGNVDFTNVKLYQHDGIMAPDLANAAIIERLVELGIGDAKVLGKYSINSDKVVSDDRYISPLELSNLDRLGFGVVASMPTKEQLEVIRKEVEPVRSISLDQYLSEP